MTKHRIILAFVTVALLAAATTSATIRSHPTDRAVASAGVASLKGPGRRQQTPDKEFDDQSLVFSTKR